MKVTYSRSRTRLAKALYWLSGELSVIKTYQRTYELSRPVDLGETPYVTTCVGRMWRPCALSFKLVKWSLDVDPRHWNHWALQHLIDGPCVDGYPCSDCGGHVDPPMLTLNQLSGDDDASNA